MEGRAVNETKCDFHDVPWAGEYSSKDGDFSFADSTPVGRAEVTAELCKF